MYLFHFIIVSLLLCSEATRIDEKIGKFIIDVTTNMYTRSSFTIFLCSETSEKLFLLLSLTLQK